MGLMGHVLRAVLWQGLFRPGAEWCELAREENGWRLSGAALVATGDEPSLARYEIALAPDWSTRQARIAVRAGVDERERRLRLRADDDRNWHVERDSKPGADAPADDLKAVQGLIDIDLGVTPATNTLPIRRLAPAVGRAVDVTALWVRFPELTIEPLPQRYTRTTQDRYRYESAGGAFVAELEVDDLGLVVTYEGGWQRIAASSAAAGTP
jgi:uncharacterized protein